MSDIRYGLIGAGMMAREHIRNIALLGDVRVTAVADPDPGMRAEAAGLAGGSVAQFADHRDLIAADLCDVFLVVSPNDTHFAIMKDLLATDKPILCEKPICITSADSAALLRLAERRAAPVWVAMEYRYMPPVQTLLRHVEAGTVGTPRMMSIREHRFPFLEKIGDWNRFNERTGGTLVEKCCHFWDLMRLTLKSDPVRVYASGAADVNHRDERYGGRVPDIIDNAYVVIDFASGARGMLDLCMFAEGSYWQEVISVIGEKARVDAFIPGPARFSPTGEERHAEIAISDRATKQEMREVVQVDETILNAGDHHGSTYYQHSRFVDLVRSGRGTPEVGLRDGHWSVLIGAAAEESARTGRAVLIGGFE